MLNKAESFCQRIINAIVNKPKKAEEPKQVESVEKKVEPYVVPEWEELLIISVKKEPQNWICTHWDENIWWENARTETEVKVYRTLFTRIGYNTYNCRSYSIETPFGKVIDERSELFAVFEALFNEKEAERKKQEQEKLKVLAQKLRIVE